MSLTQREKAIIDRTYKREVILEPDNFEQRKLLAYRVSRLSRISKKLRRLYTDSCNGWPMPKTEYRDGKKYLYDICDTERMEKSLKTERRLEAEVEMICSRWGIQFHINGDPRGPCLSRRTIKINLNPQAWRSCADDVDFMGMDTDLLERKY